MNCINKKKNMAECPCDYDPCPRKGVCCACLTYHKENKELPACLREKEWAN